jgi:hypothetical protein
MYSSLKRQKSDSGAGNGFNEQENIWIRVTRRMTMRKKRMLPKVEIKGQLGVK